MTLTAADLEKLRKYADDDALREAARLGAERARKEAVEVCEQIANKWGNGCGKAAAIECCDEIRAMANGAE